MLLAALLPCLIGSVAASHVPLAPSVPSKGAIHLPVKRHSHPHSRLMQSLTRSHLEARDGCYENGSDIVVPITTVFSGASLAIEIVIDGTTLNVAPDTGSSQLWVPGYNCTTCKAAGMPTTSLPHTSDVGGRQLTLMFGRDDVTGHFASSAGSIGGVTIPNIGSLAADAIDSGLARNAMTSNGSFQGIMGLAPGLGGDPSIPQLLYRQSAISQPLLGFFLGSSPEAKDGELTIGDVTQSKWYSATKNVTLNQTVLSPVGLPARSSPYYSVTLDNIAVGTNQTEANATVVMGTGTTVMNLPASLATQVMEGLFGDAGQVINKTLVAPCDFQINQTFSLGFGGQQWPVSPDNMILKAAAVGNGLCLIGLQLLDPALAATGVQGIMGETFLRNVYSVLDFSTMQVRIHALPDTSAGN